MSSTSNKIVLYQGNADYPSLHVMVTVNDTNGTSSSVMTSQQHIKRIEDWLIRACNVERKVSA